MGVIVGLRKTIWSLLIGVIGVIIMLFRGKLFGGSSDDTVDTRPIDISYNPGARKSDIDDKVRQDKEKWEEQKADLIRRMESEGIPQAEIEEFLEDIRRAGL